MDIRDYRVWAALAVVALIAGGAFFFTRTPESDIPVVSATESLPAPLQYTGFREKESALLAAVEQSPGDAALLAQLGDLYFESDDFIQAAVQYEKALALAPDDADTYNDLGLAYHYTGRTPLAVETLRKGIEADPGYQRIWLTLGFVLVSSGQGPQAKEALQRAVELNPTNDIGLEAQRFLSGIR